ncbi:O-antigen ligase family protein [Vibrio aestuarianus]|uniref:O-antigen ligase family protein n=1 Tax=Vibrio aestuarianus TaxID=28171 RepID=A0A9X4IQ96_9VIBR|nr:O-antigen ligase [Vibrio aestuarianus]MDE1242756.1 O-antigen ligase family protein [Vibrio aestuarianus]
MRLIEKITFPLFLIFVFWLPIPLGSNRPIAWSFNEVWGALLLILCLCIYSPEHWKTSLKRTKWVIMPIMAITLWSLIQSIQPLNLTQDSGLVFVSALKSLHYLQLCLVASVLIDTRNKLKLLATVMVVSGICQGFYAGVVLLLHLEHSPIFNLPLGTRASGSFVYHNHLANFLMLNLCIGFGLLIAQLSDSSKTGLRNMIKQFFAVLLSDKAFVRLGLVIMVIALVLTRSRMGNIAFFIALTLGSILLLFFYKPKPRSVYVLIISLFLIDTFIVSNWFGLEKVKQRLVETSLESESRDDVIRYSLVAIQERPLTGYGAGTFYSTFPAYNQGDVKLFYDHAHNDYIQFVFEYGFVASAILLLMILVSGKQAFHAFKNRRSKLMRGIGLSSVMAIIGMTIHMSVDFPLQAPANTLYFLLCLLMGHWANSIPNRVDRKEHKT